MLLSKSAPLDIWAFIILSVSSNNVGIKRNAIVIIIANSCTGNPTLLNGDKSLSIPSVNCIGDVVSVNKDVPTTKYINLIAINIACLKPASVIFKKPNWSLTPAIESTSPGRQNILITNVNNRIHLRGFNPFIMYFIGISDALTTAAIIPNIITYGQNWFTTNSAIINIIAAIILVLGSNLWILEFAG